MSSTESWATQQDKDPPAGGDHLSTFGKLYCQVDNELDGLAYTAQRARQNSDLAEATVLAVRTIQTDLGELMGLHTAAVRDLEGKAAAAYRAGLEAGKERGAIIGEDALETLHRIDRRCQGRRPLLGRLFRRGAKEAS